MKTPVRGQPPSWEPSPNLKGATVILVRTQGPINLGMVARICGNLGIEDLRLVSPLCEVNCEDSRKFSTHSKELLLAARRLGYRVTRIDLQNAWIAHRQAAAENHLEDQPSVSAGI